MSRDPKWRDYAFQSAYSSFNNNPLYFADPSGKSGEATIDKQAKTITIRSHIIMYGSEASAELATATANSIQNAWNDANGTVMIDGEQFNVIFEITAEYKPGITMAEIRNNKDIKKNYIRVDDKTGYGDGGSFMDGPNGYRKGGNTGWWKLSELLGETTEIHEYGHGLGQEHKQSGVPYEEGPSRRDIRGQGVPNIGVPRGTIVDPEYQRDPNAAPAEEGGTLDPTTRRVQQVDIDQLGLDQLNFSEDGKADVGTLSNSVHKRRGDKQNNPR